MNWNRSFSHDIPEIAFYFVFRVHASHEVHIVLYLIVVDTAGMSELVVDDGNAAGIYYHSVRPQDVRLPLCVYASDVAFIIDDVSCLEP